MVLHIFHFCAQGAEQDGPMWVQVQNSLHIALQVSRNFLIRPYLKTKNKNKYFKEGWFHITMVLETTKSLSVEVSFYITEKQDAMVFFGNTYIKKIPKFRISLCHCTSDIEFLGLLWCCMYLGTH